MIDKKTDAVTHVVAEAVKTVSRRGKATTKEVPNPQGNQSGHIGYSSDKSERRYIEKLREQWSDVIWDKTNSAKPELRHPETARAIIEEFRIVSVERSRSDYVFMQYSQEHGYWQRILHGSVDRMIADLVGSKCTQAVLRSVGTLIRAYSAVAPEQLDAQHDLINLANCAYDLNKYEPVAHAAEHYFTHKTIYRYDSTATCPIFTDVLRNFSLGDENWILLFWEILGYCLTHSYEYQYIFWWPGRAGNGKGTVIRVLSKLLGSVFVKPDFNMKRLSDRFYKGSLIGKRCAICGDMPTELVNIHILKQLSGGDAQSTDTKFGEEKHFEPTAKLLFAMNKYPAVPSTEPIAPILRRIVLLPFDYTIKSHNPDIEKQFEEELPGIFNEAIRGLRRLRSNQGQFTRCERGELALGRWAGTLNTFRAFLRDRCVIEPSNRKEGMFLFELFYYYKEYMDIHSAPNWINTDDAIKSTHQLSQALSELGLQSELEYYNSNAHNHNLLHNGKSVRGRYPKYYGIRLKQDSDYTEESVSEESLSEETVSQSNTTSDEQLPF